MITFHRSEDISPIDALCAATMRTGRDLEPVVGVGSQLRYVD